MNAAYANGFAHTFGSMLRQLEPLSEFPAELFERLKAAKGDRDILAHRFFPLNDLAILSVDGRTKMIAWCEGRIELFKALDAAIEAFLTPMQEQYGITQEAIDREIELLINEARSSSDQST